MPVVPTLSERGWVRDTREKIDFLFAHYLEAEVSTNIQTAIMKDGHDITALVQTLRDNLYAYLSTYFTSVKLEIFQDPNDDPLSSAVNLRVRCSVVDEGQEISVGMVLQSVNSRFKILTDINNYGEKGTA